MKYLTPRVDGWGKPNTIATIHEPHAGYVNMELGLTVISSLSLAGEYHISITRHAKHAPAAPTDLQCEVALDAFAATMAEEDNRDEKGVARHFWLRASDP